MHNGSSLRITSPGEGQGLRFEMILRAQRAQPAPAQDPAASCTSSLAAPGRWDGDASGCCAPGHAAAQPSTPHESAPAPGVDRDDDAKGVVLEPGGARVPQGPGGSAAGQGKGGEAHVAVHCLYAEDDPMLRLTISFQLASEVPALALYQVTDGIEALEAYTRRIEAESNPFDVIVLDNQMPNLDGTQTAAMLRSRGFIGLLIGLTGDPKGSDARAAFEAAGLDLCADKTSAGLHSVIERL
mmetsp:Transcript_10227/g.27834  ORF Transcript_10227/g.27834 Transcript_10227/m.27834 type:complete len:241 (+) Transcript_10227:1695-2417(+)